MSRRRKTSWFYTGFLNNIRVKDKLRGLYVFCVLIPLIITDVLVFYGVLASERSKMYAEMENEANLVKSYFVNTVEDNANLAKSVYLNEDMNEFLNKKYFNEYDYISSYYSEIYGSFFETLSGIDSRKVAIYVDNKTIVNGNYFQKLDRKVYAEEWYNRFIESGRSDALLAVYDANNMTNTSQRRRIMYVRRLNSNLNQGCAKIMVVENYYTNFLNGLKNLNCDYPIYVCCGDKVILSNVSNAIYIDDFETFSYYDRVGVTKDVSLYGTDLSIHVLKGESDIGKIIWDNRLILIIMILVSVIVPLFAMGAIEKSVTERIQRLEKTFRTNGSENFAEIEDAEGADEIGSLMRSYNDMARTNNELIQTAYKDKLREQESNIARKNAELHALQSQINPHFLFNSLESIRMHSLLRGEKETAEMVEKLAVMERQNVEWGNDFVEIRKEMEFIEAYLVLQNYRFGERMSFKIDVAPDCENIKIPKLTIVTFVENACVHGIEAKATPGWIFVRVNRDGDWLNIEVEDTGGGMEEDEVAEWLDKMNNVTIEELKGKKHIGMLNACLRLKMMTDNKVTFDIDSEKGIGMSVLVSIPIEDMKKEGENDA